jgi:hypothetical protein
MIAGKKLGTVSVDTETSGFQWPSCCIWVAAARQTDGTTTTRSPITASSRAVPTTGLIACRPAAGEQGSDGSIKPDRIQPRRRFATGAAVCRRAAPRAGSRRRRLASSSPAGVHDLGRRAIGRSSRSRWTETRTRRPTVLPGPCRSGRSRRGGRPPRRRPGHALHLLAPGRRARPRRVLLLARGHAVLDQVDLHRRPAWHKTGRPDVAPEVGAPSTAGLPVAGSPATSRGSRGSPRSGRRCR